MRTNTQRTAGRIAIIASLLVFSLGCVIITPNFTLETVDVGEIRRESNVTGRRDADQVRVYVKLGAGDLEIDSGADALMEADFTFNVDEWEPEVSYEMDDGLGRLTIRQPTTNKITTGANFRYEWDLRFSEDVPIEDMRIEYGAGTGDIDLGQLNVKTLDMKLGAGDMDVDLRNNHSLERLEIDVGAGEINLDLTGNWEHDVDVDIQGGLGKTSLRLPSDIGVRVDLSKGIGSVEAFGLRRQGGVYVNDAYGESSTTVEINIQAGVGTIELEVVD